jgi:hypothetical protein
MNHVYDSNDCAIFSEALSHAWQMYLRAGLLNPSTIDIAEAALTYAIFDAAANGQRNARRLAIAAFARVDRYQTWIRAERSWTRPTLLKSSEKPDIASYVGSGLILSWIG